MNELNEDGNMGLFDWFYERKRKKLEKEAHSVGLAVDNDAQWEFYIRKEAMWDIIKLTIYLVLLLLTIYMAMR